MRGKIYFDSPAAGFLEALPIGNGRIGAMIDGGLVRERIILNESSMWSGSRENGNREDAAACLEKIRELLREGHNYEAEQLFYSHFTCSGSGSNFGHGADAAYGCYQMAGILNISSFQALSFGRETCYAVENYRRILDLNEGVVYTEFVNQGVKYRREYIASKSRETLYLHFTASEKKKISLSVGLDRDECFETEKYSRDTLLMRGQLEDGKRGRDGVRYACAVKVVPVGGEMPDRGSRIMVAGADEVTVIVAMRTDLCGFLGKKRTVPGQEVMQDLEKAAGISWPSVKDEYVKWYQNQAERMHLSFGLDGEKDGMTTPERIRHFVSGGSDPNLLALYVDFARYEMIASSQMGGFPANLQGIWADEIQTPWNGDWHLNGQQEIYWLVEKAGLSSNHEPFLKLTEELVEPGTETACKYYGAKGWVVHTMTNPWGVTTPMEDVAWGATTGSTAWQCHHLFEHYLYSGDVEYLERIYPVMKMAAEFYLDMLVEKKGGGLVVSPSTSPENHFFDEDGRECALCEGSAYDRELVSALFEECMQAQHVLQNDAEFAQRLKTVFERLAPVEIAPDGRIREWDKDYRETRLFHRHLSHLWGVYPGNRISQDRRPDFAAAAWKSLLVRGRATPGWAIGWRLCIAARLGKGKEAFGYIRDAFAFSTAANFMNLSYHCDETLLHPDLPDQRCRHQFALDGNQANAAGILLLLVDDDACIEEDGKMKVFVRLLPALPKELSKGRAEGIRVKGKMKVSLCWEEGKLTKACLEGTAGQETVIAYGDETRSIVLNTAGKYEW